MKPFLDVRSVSRIPENAKSVLTFLLPYYIGQYEHRNVARYSLADDYHVIALDILNDMSKEFKKSFPHNAFVPFVDSSPINEVKAAHMSGLGVLGKNGQLINLEFGSYVFICAVVTDLYLEPSKPIGACSGCGQCIKKCPTGALSESGVQKEICRSFITQKKGELTAWEQKQIAAGKLVWGCDICSSVCPMNASPRFTAIPEFWDNIISVITADNLAQSIKTKAYGYKGEGILRRNLRLL